MKRRLLSLVLLWCLNAVVYPLDLGQITVLSGINQPCKLEIPILNPNHIPLHAIKVHFSPLRKKSYGYALQGAITHHNGQARIQISSEQRIRTPYLKFSLQVSSPEGQLERAFLVLFDP